MNITITGNLGSGKSTICNLLKREEFTIISAGDLFRNIAKEQNLSVLELNKKVEEDLKIGKHDIDDLIDERTKKCDEEMDHVIFDSRLAWHFTKNSFKIFLLTNINEATKRILMDNRSTEIYKNEQECHDLLLSRQRIEQSRFSDLYGIDYYNINNYNLVLDTTNTSPEIIKETILKEFDKYSRNEYKQKIMLNPSSIFPTQNTRDLSETILDHYIKDEKQISYDAIIVGMKNNEWYVIDGHHRLLASLYNKQLFIEVNPSELPIPSISTKIIYDFEDIGNFRYKYYPSDHIEDNLLHFKREMKTVEKLLEETTIRKQAKGQNDIIEER